jgi:ferredoxin-NADP reductase
VYFKVPVQTQEAQVTEVRDLSPLVRELTLMPLGWEVSFKPGQWVSLHLPVGQHPPLLRAYSLAEPQSVSGHLVLAFDRVPRGLGSGYLFTLKTGDKVVLAGPYGKFVLPEPLTQDLLLIARYTGIVPIRCMLKYLFAGAYDGDGPVPAEVQRNITLVYGSPHSEEFIYHREFVGLASRYSAFRYMPFPLGDSQPVVEAIGPLVKGRRDLLPMVSGIKAFVHPLRTYLTELGFGRKEIRHETYD